MKPETKIIAENICQARNLFKTEFSPQTTQPEELAERISNKIYSEYGYATKHFEETFKK